MISKKFDNICESISAFGSKITGKAYTKFSDVENTLNQKSKINSVLIVLMCLVCFAAMYLMNINTPLAADDFPYSFIYTEEQTDADYIVNSDFFHIGERVTSVSDIFESMRVHYSEMNGRVFIHFIVQLMLLIGKPTFNIINSLVYVATMLLIYKHCIGRRKNSGNAVLFAAICLAVWTFSPSWGITTIWLCGSVNYLWGSMVRLTALLFYRLYADDGVDKHKVIKTPLVILLCLCAGSTNENSSAAFIGITVLFIIYYRIKKFKIPVWSVLGLISSLCGFAFMCLAPGNSKRVADGNETGNGILTRLINIPARTVIHLSFFAAAFIIITIILYRYANKDKPVKFAVGLIYLIGAVAGAFVMIASPLFPERAWFGITILAIVAVGNMFSQLKMSAAFIRQSLIIAVAFWGFWGGMTYIRAVEDAQSVMNQYNERVEYIEEQKAIGNYDVELINFYSENEHSPLYGLTDLGLETYCWQRVSKCKYYGIKTITRIYE